VQPVHSWKCSQITDGAELELTAIEPAWECRACGRPVLSARALRCADCGAPARMVRGDEIVLERLELEVA
jgi:Zn finger protein HypA/HybF involved in hydrogenase expression